jgi:hypothetical protein
MRAAASPRSALPQPSDRHRTCSGMRPHGLSIAALMASAGLQGSIQDCGLSGYDPKAEAFSPSKVASKSASAAGPVLRPGRLLAIRISSCASAGLQPPAT